VEEVNDMRRMSVSSMMNVGAEALAASKKSMRKMKRKVKSLF